MCISMGKFVMESQQCDYSDLIVECKGSLWRGGSCTTLALSNCEVKKSCHGDQLEVQLV